MSLTEINSVTSVATERSPSTELKRARRASALVSIEQFALGINDYQTFCRKRGRSLEPTPETLRAYVVYVGQCQGVDAVEGYLNAICVGFEHVYPNMREHCRSALVEKTIREMREAAVRS